jgi:hypothetical protein
MIMPYKDPIKQREASRKLMVDYRERQRGACKSLYQKEKNRLGFLELEVERLQKCLLHKVSVPQAEHTVKT